MIYTGLPMKRFTAKLNCLGHLVFTVSGLASFSASIELLTSANCAL